MHAQFEYENILKINKNRPKIYKNKLKIDKNILKIYTNRQKYIL